MARIMKVQIRIILSTSNILTIDVDENETFEQFQNKCIQLHGLTLDKEYFSFQDNEIDNDINLSQYINSFNTNDPDDHSELIVYEIRLQPEILLDNDINPETLPIKSENMTNTIDNSFINYPTEDLSEENILNFNNEKIFDNEAIINQTLHFNKEKNQFDILNIENNAINNLTENQQNENSKNLGYNYMEIESKLREIHDSTEEFVTDYCRLCATTFKENNKKIDIFGSNEIVLEQINSYLPLKMSNDDNLPQQICEECDCNLKIVSNFVQSVLQADNILRLKFSTEPKNGDSVKIEQSDSDFVTESIFKCRFCQEEIPSAVMSVKHSIEAHFNRNNLYICVLCEMGYTKLELLENHVKLKHEGSGIRKFNYKCKTCSKRFMSLINLQKHTCLKSKMPLISLHCEICNLSFPSKVRLNFHRQFHLKNSRSLFCTECRQSFKDESSYFDHVNFFHDPEQIYVCEQCEKTFTLRSAFMNHKKMHIDDKNYKCDTCQKVFLSRQALNEHESTHLDTPYQCQFCNKRLSRMSRLRKHLLTHKAEPVVTDIFCCTICKECFESKNIADKHNQELHGNNEEFISILKTDKVFLCEFCEKNFSDTETLNFHRLEHQSLTPYICRICKAQFTTYARCSTHKTTHGIHNDESKSTSFPVLQHYLCEHCNKSYLHWSYLSLHRKLKHSDNNIYRCKDCHFEVNNPWALADHRRNKHEDYETITKPEEILKCKDCEKLFNNVEALQNHQLTQHFIKPNKDLSCQKCGKVFTSQTDLGLHARIHTKVYKCSKCSKSFVHLGGLNNHLKLHKEPHLICLYCGKRFQSKIDCEQHELLHIKKKLICDVCDKSFDTKNQLLEHSQIHEQRPFECKICGLAFRRAFTLQTHMQRHAKSKHSGSFVLMVDMKDEAENQQKETTTTDVSKKNDLSNSENIELSVNSGIAENYIDIGNGNLLQVQGNTINIDGNQYLLINQNNEQQYQMVIDPTTDNYATGTMNEGDQLLSDELIGNNINNTIMLVDDTQLDSQFILTPNNFTETQNTFVIENQIVQCEQNNL